MTWKVLFQYRLGNRSALDWIIERYQLRTDKRSGIVDDPNRPDDLHYIVKLIGKVITVSLETVRIADDLDSFRIESYLKIGSFCPPQVAAD